MKTEVIRTIHGYYSVKKLPTQEELERHYKQKYYQNESIQYSHSYSDDEVKYFDNKAELAHYIYTSSFNRDRKSLLDVGAGEGFFANYFLEKDWNVTTLDYSSFGIKKHNIKLIDTLIQGDVFKSLDTLISKKNEYEFINLSNILEHVLDPVSLLINLKSLLSNESLLRISVPNDYSCFQEFLLSKDYSHNTWLCPPEHLHYFTFESLSNLLKSIGYEIVITMGEFPIELYLSNQSSNYVKNKNIGKLAHKSRIEVDNFLFERGIEKYINFYKSSADIGLSRQVIVYAKARS